MLTPRGGRFPADENRVGIEGEPFIQMQLGRQPPKGEVSTTQLNPMTTKNQGIWWPFPDSHEQLLRTGDS
jgi:hypothetical protein